MNSSYRLATAIHNNKQAVFVELDNTLYTLDHLLLEEDRKQLSYKSPADLMPLLENWGYWSIILPKRIEAAIPDTGTAISPNAVTFCAPVLSPKKLVCIGANYKDHIAEMNIPMLPDYPYSFFKPATTTLRGSGAKVSIPSVAKMVDWEAELAVVIGKHAKNVRAADALQYIAGYSNLNDLSARDWIAKRPPVGIDWVRHKGHDGFAPMGPYFLPAKFVPDPQNMSVKLSVNGAVKQLSNTGQMVFGVAEIIEHLSSIFTLEPGDIIATGTPAGVGHGRDPQEFLAAGDIVEMEVEGLGVLITEMA
ncbi:fumarylacetoacetate hydrolase family protein [Kordiimonas pumila]|uniref:Fumarylacetoacetate hydrolase family protein n=1 Tax=Kordiimonas pumila TaxID=2161677 RepID=A0ABV7D873_9PROT|nr:fumarylacetoacetate hydrolase family protein [Kordiimonas pumila]